MIDIKANTISAIKPHQQNNNKSNKCHCCNKEITDNKGLYALKKYWHEACLKCDKCSTPLAKLGDRFYERDNQIYCRWDYLRMFGKSGTCKLCQQSIPPTDYILRFHGNCYHLDCFKCTVCDYRFCVGEQVHIPAPGQILCTEHVSIFPQINLLNPLAMPLPLPGQLAIPPNFPIEISNPFGMSFNFMSISNNTINNNNNDFVLPNAPNRRTPSPKRIKSESTNEGPERKKVKVSTQDTTNVINNMTSIISTDN